MSPRRKPKRLKRNSGVTGVTYTRSGAWEAYIHRGGRKIYLGTFYGFDEAVAARKEAETGTYLGIPIDPPATRGASS